MGKVTDSLGCSRDWRQRKCCWRVIALPFVRRKKECVVFTNRTAKRSAKLVLVIGRVRLLEVVTGVQNCVSYKLVSVAVVLICPCLRDEIDYRTRIPSKLRIKGVCQHSKFLDTVGGGLNRWQIQELIICISTVDAEIVSATASTIDRNSASVLASQKTVWIRSVCFCLGLHTRLQLNELIHIARVKRKLHNGTIINHGSQLRARSIDQGHLRRDLHRLVNSSNL